MAPFWKWTCKYQHVRLSFALAVMACALPSARAGNLEDATNPFAAVQESLDKRLAQMLEEHQDPTSTALLPDLRSEQGSEVDTTSSRIQDAHPGESAQTKLVWTAVRRLDQMRAVLEQGLERRGVPKELVGVAAIESGGDPFAVSKRHACGLWQLMSGTARQYGLQVEPNQDDRLHVDRATWAAGSYLRDLYAQFRDWPLALTAYNAGPAAVQRALHRSHAETFQDLLSRNELPPETKAYVPAVLSAMSLLRSEPAAVSRPKAQFAASWVYALTVPARESEK